MEHSSFLQSILNLPGEEILVAKRKHWETLIAPIFATVFLSLIFLFSAFYVFVYTIPAPLLLLSSLVAIVLLDMTLITRYLVDWYFHMYVVTNRKILEICYTPMFSHNICDVLLDQVRCTEIDVRINGIVNEILNKGNIIVSFDRPTHQEEFIFTDIQDPREVGHMLGHAFASIVKEDPDTFWYRLRDGKRKSFGMIQEIFPKRSVGVS